MRRIGSLAAALLLATCPVTAQLGWAPAVPGSRVAPLRVDAAITLGVEFVKSKQRDDGSFPGHDERFPMGMTSLCLLTMVKCGVAPSDPAVTRALERLRYLPFKRTYSTGCLLMALEALHPPGAKEWAQRGVDFLVATQHNSSYWSYPEDNWEKTGNVGVVDLSNTQYAVLGLRAAKRLGCKVPTKPIARLVRALVDDQADSGAFRYRSDSEVTGGMTVAGLAILSIAETLARKSPIYGREKRGVRDAFKRGSAWLARRFDAAWNPWGDERRLHKTWHLYYLYGVERHGALADVKKLGKRDWYQDGARYLLGNQGDKGQFGSLENTCFALLFLRRATLSISREVRTEAVEDRRQELRELKRTWAALAKPAATLPSIRDWLTNGPYRVKDDDPFDPGEHPKPRGTPRAGVVAVSKRWEPLRGEADQIDLESRYRGGDHRLAYVATLLHAPREQPAIVWLQAYDGFRAWVNGKRIGKRVVTGMPDRAWPLPCTLRAGVNTLVIALDDRQREWTFRVRVSDATGAPIEGLVTGLSKAALRRKAPRK